MRRAFSIGAIVVVAIVVAVVADNRKGSQAEEPEWDPIVTQIQDLRQEFSALQIDMMHVTTPASYRISQHVMIIDEQLTQAYGTITEYVNRLARYQAAVTILLVILAIIVIIKLVGYILMFSNVKIPRWLDILL